MAYNILHTDSGRVADYSLPNKDDWDEQAMGFLQGQEDKLYGMLGKSNFTDFMAEIHRLLDEAGNIREILMRFKTGNIKTTFDLPQQLSLMNQTIHIRLKKFEGFNLDKLFLQLNNVSGISVNPNIGTLEFVYNEHSVKELMNVLENRDKKNMLDASSKSMETANKAFKDWLNMVAGTDSLGSFQINGKSTDINRTVQTSTKAKDLFGMTKKQIEEALQDPQLRQELIKTRQNVYNELYTLCSGAPDLQKAFKTVWKEKIGSIDSTNISDKDLRNFGFLSKGGNLAAGVPGAIQEMYGALVTEYLSLLSTQKIPKGLVEIIGDVIEGEKEQPKADLVILNEIGIQVKAYGMDNVIRHMESNLHPNALDAQLIPYGAVNVGDAIVQSVFNTSNESPTSIASKLRDYGAALLNLATSKDLGVRNTVCFYLIDAQYLVPGSKIIEAFNTQKSEYNVKITSSYQGKSDAEWREKGYTPYSPYDNRIRLSPNYMEFFDKEGTDQIHAEDRNKDTYTVLYTSKISIRTIFDYSFAGGDKSIYSIF